MTTSSRSMVYSFFFFSLLHAYDWHYVYVRSTFTLVQLQWHCTNEVKHARYWFENLRLRKFSLYKDSDLLNIGYQLEYSPTVVVNVSTSGVYQNNMQRALMSRRGVNWSDNDHSEKVDWPIKVKDLWQFITNLILD